jgi:ABC-2 type transport system ATP-binding protein
MQAIEIKNLRKTYESGTQALKGVDLTIQSGDFFALLGANGAGKTTLIGVLTGLVRKSEGDVNVYGVDIDRDHARAKQMIGLVPQEFNFNIFEKVQDIVIQQAGFFGLSRREAVPRCEKILKALSLWDKREQKSMSLSGGMKRRLMIARALMHDPKLLILDEPTAGVDVELRHDMWDYLRELNRSGTTILLTTHYIEEAEQLCKNLAIIKDGEIIREGGVKALVRSLEHQGYVIDVEAVKHEAQLEGYQTAVIDENTFSVNLSASQNLTDLLNAIRDRGMVLKDIRPQGNRLEQLYLDILKQ